MADPPSENRIEIDKDAVRRDLMKLVLTIVELLRQLMERQAIRRAENSELTEQQEEDLGTALMLLSDAMDELTEQFGLTPADLNLDLGPLGPLLPRDR
ncbi:gas vesicle protein K [Actinomycetospora sp. CA-084318]|uniref:gas vesicle protein K n=1 Tax=Actinomycetospora sp. CA-084318 TaxID=3239892 RepID=UPI003D96CE93